MESWRHKDRDNRCTSTPADEITRSQAGSRPRRQTYDTRCGLACSRGDMADIVLTTLNAKYAHAALGLRYLMANLGPLRQHARILEFDVTQRAVDVLEAILLARFCLKT